MGIGGGGDSSSDTDLEAVLEGLDFSDDEASNENKKGPNKSSKECQVKQKKVQFGGEAESTTSDTKPAKTAPETSSMAARKKESAVTFDDDDLLSALDDKKASGSRPSSGRRGTGNKPSSGFMDSLFGGDSIGKKNEDAPSTGGKKEFSLDEKYMKPAETKATPSAAKRPDPLDFGGQGKSNLESASAAGGRRRRGGPTTTASGPNLDLDDDKLFQGTSLGQGASSVAPPTANQPPPAVTVSHPQQQPQQQHQQQQPPPPWLSQPAQQQPQQQPPVQPVQQQPPPWQAQPPPVQPVQQQPPPWQAQPPPPMAAVAPPVNQQLVDMYQQQISQMQDLERRQQGEFERDLEGQKRMLESKQQEHRMALEQQRNLAQDQVRAMQERQSSILMQQQTQTEVLMKQIQAQMESELKTKSELVRNQLTILTEIQMQNPHESLDMKGLLDQVQQSVGMTKMSAPSAGNPNRDKDTLEEIESLYKEREERLRSAHAEHVEELEARISSLLERRRAMLESHREELVEERERRRRELVEQSEEYKDAIQTLKSEYTVAIDRIREMRAAEDEAQEETGRSARSVETLAVQVSSATRELDGLQEKVDERLRRHVDAREVLIAQKEETIKNLQERLERRQTEHDEAERRLREQIEGLERDSRDREEGIETRERKLRAEEMTMEGSKRKFKAEREVERRKDEQESRLLQEERLYLEHERKSFQRLVLEQSELAAAERARAAIRQKKSGDDAKRANFEPAVEDQESPQRRNVDEIAKELAPKTHSELRGILVALEEERKDIGAKRNRITEFQEKLAEQKSCVAEERKTVLEAVAKLGLAEKKFAAKMKGFEEVANSCARLRKESRRCLSHSKKLTADRADVVRGLKEQLEALHRKERRMVELTMAMEQERGKLEHAKATVAAASAMCARCKERLRSATDAPAASAGAPVNRTVGDGQYSVAASHIASLRADAQRDEEYLEKETRYLKSLGGVDS